MIKLAYTGVAAWNIQGKTIHNFFGISNSYNIPSDRQVEQFLKLHEQVVFLVDEVSMISGQFKDIMEECLQHVKRNTSPWGGMQVAFFGDFAQLLPFGADDYPVMYSKLFRDITVEHVFHPQRCTDPRLMQLLDNVRYSNLNETEVVALLLSRTITCDNDIPVDSIVLTPRKQAGREYNLQQLQNIEGESHMYEGKTIHLTETGSKI